MTEDRRREPERGPRARTRSRAARSPRGAASPAAAGYPTEAIPKFEPKENFATLYPDKKILLEKKSPVDRIDLAPPGFKTYKNTYPGLFGDRGIVTAPEVKPKAPPPPAAAPPAEAAPAPAA